MVTFRAGPAVLALQVALLLTLGVTVGWGATGWVTGFAALAVLDGAVAHLMRSGHVGAVGPADLVTLLRATFACGITGLVAQSFLDAPDRTTIVVALAALALALDAVDGWVARATGTASALGARFDGEADAYLMLVLSVYVVPDVGWWVLAIGLARYAFAVAGWILPWLRAQLPPRYWRKVVTAVAGVALVVAAAGVVPSPLIEVLLAVALLLVAESFGRDVWWLWRHRSGADTDVNAGTATP